MMDLMKIAKEAAAKAHRDMDAEAETFTCNDCGEELPAEKEYLSSRPARRGGGLIMEHTETCEDCIESGSAHDY